MNINDRINSSYSYVSQVLKDYNPSIGIILGSGLGSFVKEIKIHKTIPYSDIPDFPKCTVQGHQGQFVVGEVNNKRIICMQGRFHFYEGYTIQEVVLPIWIFKNLGVKTLVVTNAAGGINNNFVAGDLMVITDHINLLAENPLIGNPTNSVERRFFDMTEAYSKRLIRLLHEAAIEEKISAKEGVYGAVKGPNFETPAEVRMMRILGIDAIGMSTIPEVLTARQAEIEVCGVSCITNLAAGISPVHLSHLDVMETAKKVENYFPKLISTFIKNL